ncbi:MAG: ArsC/Spx/MgsR family protein [Acidimicrobiales bacterium]
MADITIYHNPKCSTSRAALEVLEASGQEFEVIRYLTTPPDRADLERLLTMLEDDPADLVRRDPYFKDTLLAGGFDPDTLSDPSVVIDVLLEHPRLLQRPVVVKGDTAIIGRPKDRVPALLNG